MPLRLLTRKQLSTAFSNFTQRLAKLRLTPLSLNPTLLMQSQVQSSLKRRRLDTDRRRTRNLVAPLQGEGTDSARKEDPRVDPAHRDRGVNVHGMEDLVDSLNEDLILEVRLHVPVLRPVDKRLRRRVLTPRPQLFFREGSDRSDPGMLAISGPGFSLLIPLGGRTLTPGGRRGCRKSGPTISSSVFLRLPETGGPARSGFLALRGPAAWCCCISGAL